MFSVTQSCTKFRPTSGGCLGTQAGSFGLIRPLQLHIPITLQDLQLANACEKNVHTMASQHFSLGRHLWDARKYAQAQLKKSDSTLKPDLRAVHC